MAHELKDKLLKKRVKQEEVKLTVDGEQVTVTVRGLTRVEALMVQEETSTRGYDARTIAIGFVDPPFTYEEALAWQDASPAGEIDPATNKIAELSLMTKDSGQKAYLKMEDDPGAEFRVPTGAEA
jgi:hypothetical protein